jgi:hypothetical protein
MIITDEELLSFFKSKVECSIAQILKRGWNVGLREYNLYRHYDGNDGNYDTWRIECEDDIRSIHPLSLVLVGQKVICDREIEEALARRLGCKESFIDAFNRGLASRIIGKKLEGSDIHKQFYEYGREVRVKHTKQRYTNYTIKKKPIVY